MERRQIPCVGAVVVDGGRLLLVLRGREPAAGLWSIPGGKVEPGESPDDALVREVAEELGCTVVVTGWLERSVTVSPGLSLLVGLARIVEAEPDPVEHDEVRWLGAAELGTVDWLDADRPFLPDLRVVLARGGC